MPQIGGLFNMKLAAVSKAVLSFERELDGNRGLVKMAREITSKIEV